jgi:uncharacterized membrane protein YdjX (TVP38/TMEM64 family)
MARFEQIAAARATDPAHATTVRAAAVGGFRKPPTGRLRRRVRPVLQHPAGFVSLLLLRRLAVAGFVLVPLVAFVRTVGGEIPRFSMWVQAQGAWAPFAYLVGYVIATIAFVPGALPTMAAGVIFGLWTGTFYAFLGEILGGVVAFLLARSVARPLVEHRLARSLRFTMLDRAVAAQGRRIVFMLRLSPAVPFNLLNYALGITNIRLLDYVLASIGMLPGAFLYVYYGKLIGDVAALASGAAPEHDRTYWLVTGLGLAATIAASVVLARIATRALREASVVPPDDLAS